MEKKQKNFKPKVGLGTSCFLTVDFLNATCQKSSLQFSLGYIRTNPSKTSLSLYPVTMAKPKPKQTKCNFIVVFEG